MCLLSRCSYYVLIAHFNVFSKQHEFRRLRDFILKVAESSLVIKYFSGHARLHPRNNNKKAKELFIETLLYISSNNLNFILPNCRDVYIFS